MFESLVEKLLQRVFGEFLEGIDREHLKVSIWSGVIRLSNVQFKRSFFLKLNLPVALKMGILRKLVVNIPWRSLGSKPVIAELEGVYVVLEAKPKSEWALIDTISYAIKREIITAFAEQCKQIVEVFTYAGRSQSKEKGSIQAHGT